MNGSTREFNLPSQTVLNVRLDKMYESLRNSVSSLSPFSSVVSVIPRSLNSSMYRPTETDLWFQSVIVGQDVAVQSNAFLSRSNIASEINDLITKSVLALRSEEITLQTYNVKLLSATDSFVTSVNLPEKNSTV
ncbi:MAG: hypothetical protein WBA74_19785, partial [Cyclobacteriaceae bacterium]